MSAAADGAKQMDAPETKEPTNILELIQMATFKSLEECLTYLQSQDGRNDDGADLPTFGGTDPRDLDAWPHNLPVWSWDEQRALVGLGSDDMRIVDIAEVIGSTDR